MFASNQAMSLVRVEHDLPRERFNGHVVNQLERHGQEGKSPPAYLFLPRVPTRREVPHCENRHLRMTGVVREDTQRPCAEREMLPFDDRKSDPSCGQDEAEVPMRKQSNVSLQRAKSGDETIGAVGYLFR
jgi:hypothetical protein